MANEMSDLAYGMVYEANEVSVMSEELPLDYGMVNEVSNDDLSYGMTYED